MLFHNLATHCFALPDAAVVRPLRTRVTLSGKTDWLVEFRIPNRVFLLEAEPEIIVVVGNRRATVGLVWIALAVEYFAHHEEACAKTAWIGNAVDWFEQAVA